MKRPRTVFEAGQARRDEAAESIGRAIEAQSKLNAERAALALYPEIGILTRKGKSVFYAYVGGYAEANYREGTIEELSRLISPKPRVLPPSRMALQAV